MLNTNHLCRGIRETPLEEIADALIHSTEKVFKERSHGHLYRWNRLLSDLPKLTPSLIDLSNDAVTLGCRKDSRKEQRKILYEYLQSFQPWRNGPFNLFDIFIDSEWCSHKKWDRFKNRVNFTGKTILDIGCGNGYFLFRMIGSGAKCVLGIEPNQLFIAQFCALKMYYENYDMDYVPFVLPIKSTEFPFQCLSAATAKFDTVLSMGILYHRRNPNEHLQEIKNCLKHGGELILDTLVIKGDTEDELIPHNRYAKMRNVWSIPTVKKLKRNLLLNGFLEIDIVDVSNTNTDEQRRTKWMTFESLQDFLDPRDQLKTIEGYPAPTRAMFRCIAAH